jgi:hypothetical protein
MDSPLPEFRVPLTHVQPGMVLARNVEQGGVLLLRHGLELDQERIDRLQEHGVRSLYVNFTDADIDTYKRLLIGDDAPPTYERLVDLAREVFIELIPPAARPLNSVRDATQIRTVLLVIEHTFDLLFSSRRMFELLRLTRFFQMDVLAHCPAAWVYALAIGAGLGYNIPALLELSLSALFYDIGMLRVPGKILSKPGRLTELEYAEIKKHVFFGRKLLEDIASFSVAAPLVAFEHHEHYYGGGYPKNKRGDAIHEFSQIVALTDKFAALVTDRQYRDAFQPYEAYELLLAQTKSTVSPRIFVAFLKSVLLYPRGAQFRMSTGEIGEPIDFPLHMPTRPTVRITHTATGEELIGQDKVYNLVQQPQITIEAFSIAADELRPGVWRALEAEGV